MANVIELQEEIVESRLGFHQATFPEVGGGYELTVSYNLAQAVGDFDGIDFYFRAKGGVWEFQTESKDGQFFAKEIQTISLEAALLTR